MIKKKKLILNIIAFVLVLDLANTTSFNTQYWLTGLTAIWFAYYLAAEKKFSKIPFLLFIVWVAINLSSSVAFGNSTKMLLVIKFGATKLFLIWFIVDIYRMKFLDTFEKIILSLTFVSLPLFLLNVLFKSQFNKLSGVFEQITNSTFTGTSYWSGIVYVNAIEQNVGGLKLIRNCGFMWEPGYFALIIVFALGYRWLTSGIKFDMAFVIYTIALITTLSTAGYLAYFVLLGAYFLKDASFSRVLLFSALTILFSYYVYSLEFIGGKMDVYLEALDEGDFNYSEAYNAVKLNRIQIAIYDIKRVARYPFGFGLNDRVSFDNVDVVGTNGLSGMMRMWGIFLFLFFIKLFWDFYKKFNVAGLSRISLFLIFLALMLVFFSQSIQYTYLPFMLIIYSLTFKKARISDKR